jgi:hypothetical protein
MSYRAAPTIAMCLALWVSLAGAAAPARPEVSLEPAGMADPHTVRLAVSAAGPAEAGPLTMSVAVPPGTAVAELPLARMPKRFPMVLDLARGEVSVGGIRIGAFAPMPPPSDNIRVEVAVTVRDGTGTATARAAVDLLLPTVIVPGYRNESTFVPDPILAAMERAGYKSAGPAPTVFWAAYGSAPLSIGGEAGEIGRYLRRVVRPAVYASRVNIVGYSVGGVVARWALAEDAADWRGLVNRLVLVGVPDEGLVIAYLADRMLPGMPLTGWAHGPLVRDLYPAFPYWRAGPGQPWSFPPGGVGTTLARLNRIPLPGAIRVYVIYGDDPRTDGMGFDTVVGITGVLPGGELSWGAGDGLVLAASAQGLPIHGGPGDPALAHNLVCRVDAGPIYHTHLLRAAVPRIAGMLRDRWEPFGLGTPASSEDVRGRSTGPSGTPAGTGCS